MPGGIYDSYDRLIKASSFTRQLRMQEVVSQAGNTTGRIVFDWQSPDNAYWIPSSSYVLMKFGITKSGNANLAASDQVDLVENVGAAAVQTAQHFINGVSVGLQSNNAVAKQVLTKAFMQRDVKESIGDVFNLTALRTDTFSGNAFVTAFQPALGVYNLDSGIAGRARHQLEMHMATNLIAAMVESNDAGTSKGRSVPGLNIVLQDIKFYAAYATPQEPIRPPSTQFINVTDLHVSSQAHTSNGSATQSYVVPASTHKIFVTSQHLDLTAATATGATGFAGCLDSASAPPQVDYAGMQVPARAYTNDLLDTHRAYLDLYAGTLLASGQSSYDSIEEWDGNRLYLHAFPKAADDTSTNVLVRFNSDGNTTPSNVFLAALHDNNIILTYGAGNEITSVNYATVS